MSARIDIHRMLETGGCLKQVVDLTDANIEALYRLGLQQYRHQQYGDSANTFGLLCLCDHQAERNWLGLGTSRQMLGDHGGAVQAYAMLAEVGGNDPRAPLFAAECFLALGMLTEAVSGLGQALEWSENSPNPAAILQRVDLLAQAIDRYTEQLPDSGAE